MKIPFVKNIDVLRFVCNDKVLYFPENTNFSGKQVDYLLTTLCSDGIDLQTGLDLKQNWYIRNGNFDIFVNLKSQEKDIAISVPLSEYCNEINTRLQPVKSVLDLKNCYLKLNQTAIDGRAVLFYVFYNSEKTDYNKFGFSYSKQIIVPAKFKGKFSDVFFQNSNARLAGIRNENILNFNGFTFPAFFTLRDKNGIQNYEYLSSNLFQAGNNMFAQNNGNRILKWAFEPFILDYDKSFIDNSDSGGKTFTLFFI